MDHDDWDDDPEGFEPADHDEDASPAPTAVERTGPRPLARSTRTSARRRAGIAAAVVAALVMGTVAFGAELGLVGSRTDGDDATDPPKAMVEPTEKSEPTEAPKATERPDATDGDDATDKPDVEPTEKPAPTEAAEPEPTKKPEPKPTEKPAPKPTEKPEPKPTEKPAPKPEVKTLEIALVIKEGHVVVKWSACGVDGAEAYKVVRSKDETVRWPTGDNDELIAVVGMDGALKAWDEHAPAGKMSFYRVFCVRYDGDGYVVLAKTPVGSIVAPEATPKPTPKPTPEVSSMWLETSVDDGAIVLTWEACGSDGFSHYRIVRKVDGEGGVIAEIEDAGTTTYRDEAVEPGVTYHYLVQAKGHVGDDWVLLGTTDWVGASID